jgi:diketogulonate reductase-like aldo/keto reductase
LRCRICLCFGRISYQEIVMSVIELASGHAMPLLGLGTWQLRGGECTRVVQMALEMGYRHLDTAYNYKNQVEVARGASGEWNRA